MSCVLIGSDSESVVVLYCINSFTPTFGGIPKQTPINKNFTHEKFIIDIGGDREGRKIN